MSRQFSFVHAELCELKNKCIKKKINHKLWYAPRRDKTLLVREGDISDHKVKKLTTLPKENKNSVSKKEKRCTQKGNCIKKINQNLPNAEKDVKYFLTDRRKSAILRRPQILWRPILAVKSKFAPPCQAQVATPHTQEIFELKLEKLQKEVDHHKSQAKKVKKLHEENVNKYKSKLEQWPKDRKEFIETEKFVIAQKLQLNLKFAKYTNLKNKYDKNMQLLIQKVNQFEQEKSLFKKNTKQLKQEKNVYINNVNRFEEQKQIDLQNIKKFTQLHENNFKNFENRHKKNVNAFAQKQRLYEENTKKWNKKKRHMDKM